MYFQKNEDLNSNQKLLSLKFNFLANVTCGFIYNSYLSDLVGVLLILFSIHGLEPYASLPELVLLFFC